MVLLLSSDFGCCPSNGDHQRGQRRPGLPGLTAALGAARDVLTDVAAVLPCLRQNAEANGLGEPVEVRELVWGSEVADIGSMDLVLMSDVFYDPDEMCGLAKSLKAVCHVGTAIWSATEVRACNWECLEVLTRKGFNVVEQPQGNGVEEEEPPFSILFLDLQC